MNKKQVYEKLREPNGSEQLARNLPAAFEGAWALFLEGDAPATGLLARAAKQKQWREEMQKRLKDRTPLYKALQADSFKMRKNTARLVGALADSVDAEELICALKNETVRMVRPSQLLALGAIQCPAAENYLKTFQLQPPADETEVPHHRAEAEALKKALSAYQSIVKHPFNGLVEPVKAKLLCPASTEGYLAKSLQNAGVTVEGFGLKNVKISICDTSILKSIRFWNELLFVFAEKEVFSAEKIGEYCRNKVLPFLLAVHQGLPPFSYRLELRGFEERGKVAQELVSVIDCAELINNPSSYEVEFRLTKNEKFVNFDVKLFTLPDSRFAYRKRELPASIHPATAAGVLELVRPYLKENAVVADPCCGSGTMLLERAQIHDCRLFGIDISAQALDAARQNFNAADQPANLLLHDARFWQPEEPLDEIISNLPFGNRVGGHSSNKKLYESLVRNLPGWLRPGGIAVLYTVEMQLLRQLVARNNKLELLKEFRTDAGGLQPAVFLIKRKN